MSLRQSGVVVRFRLLPAEYEDLVRVAARAGVSVSAAIRNAIATQHGHSASAVPAASAEAANRPSWSGGSGKP